MKAVNIIQSLTKEEFGQFKLFLQSPLFNSDPNLNRLYTVLAKYYPTFSSRQCTREKIFQKVFPKHEWNDGKWRNLLSKMVKALGEYLAILEMKANPLEGQKLLTKAYGNRNLTDLFTKHAQQLDSELAELAQKDHDALLDKMLFNQFYYYHPLTNKLDNTPYLLNAKKEAALYFKAQELKTDCDLLVLGQIHGDLFRKKESDSGIPVYIQLYEMVHSLLSEESETAFKKAEEFFQLNVKKFNIEDQKFGLLHLINFGIRQHNLGSRNYGETMFELYQLGLEENILMENGLLTEKTFENIIAINCTFRNFEWTFNFINDYNSYLPEFLRERAKLNGLGLLYFHQKNFSKSIDYFNSFNHDKLTSSLIIKSMLLRSYFEIFLKDSSYFEMLINYATAFERLIKRKKKFEETRKTGCINFSNLLKKIAASVNNGYWNEETKTNFKQLIDETNPIIVKKWLQNKVDEM